MYEEQVQSGIALLDEREPGWRDRVNLDTLDMRHNCIATQVTGEDSFVVAIRMLGISTPQTEFRYGFEINLDLVPDFSAIDTDDMLPRDTLAHYTELKRAWVDAIA